MCNVFFHTFRIRQHLRETSPHERGLFHVWGSVLVSIGLFWLVPHVCDTFHLHQHLREISSMFTRGRFLGLFSCLWVSFGIHRSLLTRFTYHIHTPAPHRDNYSIERFLSLVSFVLHRIFQVYIGLFRIFPNAWAPHENWKMYEMKRCMRCMRCMRCKDVCGVKMYDEWGFSCIFVSSSLLRSFLTRFA